MKRSFDFLLFLFVLLFSSHSFAYTPTLTSGGVGVRWSGPATLNLAGNPTNRSGLNSDYFYDAVVRGLQRWKYASSGRVNFDYWQGTDTQIYSPSSDYDGLSSIHFASNAGASLPSNVLGLTQVWYNTSTGQVLEADIVLNDNHYQFTTDPTDTSGYGSTRDYYRNGRRVYIENVVTHELGHAYGLSHSGGLQSTMLFMESPEQAKLGCDEQIGIHALYPSDDRGSRGTLRGRVLINGNGIFGAHVVAISRRRGTVLATALTNQQGNYSLEALEPGDYFIMAEPFFAGSAALPSYYSSINSNVCRGGEPFSRTALTHDSERFRPVSLNVGAGSVVQAPDLSVQCTNGGGAALYASSSVNSTSESPILYYGNGSGFGAAELITANGSKVYRLQNVSGRVEVHALSYTLYSPVRTTIRLLNSSGYEVSSRTFSPVYTGESGYTNFDSALVADSLPPGDYYIRVYTQSLDASVYPAGPQSLDRSSFVILTGSVNEGSPALASVLGTDARCSMNEGFPNYSSPPGNPPRFSVKEDDEDGGVGFCGTIDSGSSKNSSSGGPGAGAIAGWLMPWIFMLVATRIMKFRIRQFQLHVR